jgi:DNA replication licensing factor MCM5
MEDSLRSYLIERKD